jgi:hypothetical protein
MKIDEATIKSWEEHAFYEAGLSADGCIQKLGEFELAAVEKYGRILLKYQESHFRDILSNLSFYVSSGLGDENTTIEEYVKRIKDGISFIGKIDTNEKEETVSMKISHYESIVSNLDKARREADFYKAKYKVLNNNES